VSRVLAGLADLPDVSISGGEAERSLDGDDAREEVVDVIGEGIAEAKADGDAVEA
jgi:hypothetical protein